MYKGIIEVMPETFDNKGIEEALNKKALLDDLLSGDPKQLDGVIDSCIEKVLKDVNK